MQRACCHLAQDSHWIMSWPSQPVDWHTHRVPSLDSLLRSVPGVKADPSVALLLGVELSRNGSARVPSPRFIFDTSADALHRWLCASSILALAALVVSDVRVSNFVLWNINSLTLSFVLGVRHHLLQRVLSTSVIAMPNLARCFILFP